MDDTNTTAYVENVYIPNTYEYIQSLFGSKVSYKEPFFKKAGKGIKKGVKKATKAVKKAADKAGDTLENLGNDAIKALVTSTVKPILNTVENDLNNKLLTQITKPIDDIKKLDDQMTGKIKSTINSASKMNSEIMGIITRVINIPITIGKTLNASIILPILGSFNSLGTIFIILFDILYLIVKKIISIPRCIGVYFYHGTIGVMNSIIMPLLPKWIRSIISSCMYLIGVIFNTVYYTIYIVLFPLTIIGIDILGDIEHMFKSDCMSFNINGQLTKLVYAMKGIIPQFKPINFSV